MHTELQLAAEILKYSFLGGLINMAGNNTVESINDYIDKVNNFTLPGGSLVSKSIKLFRGLSDFEYDNVPSIERIINKNVHNTPLRFEEKMIDKARLKMPELFVSDIFPIQTITKLQHYGLPTRLLDFTTNALVALYFACQNKSENEKQKNGKVLIFYESEDYIYNCYSPFVNAIADMNYVSEFTVYSFYDYKKYLETKNYWKFSNYDSVDIKQIQDRLSAPIFFEAELQSERIKRQQGLFLIFPNIIEELSGKPFFKENLVKWVPKNCLELIIPSNIKSKLLRELVELGITKSYLFPEPENICTEIFDDIKDRFNF